MLISGRHCTLVKSLFSFICTCKQNVFLFWRHLFLITLTSFKVFGKTGMSQPQCPDFAIDMHTGVNNLFTLSVDCL